MSASPLVWLFVMGLVAILFAPTLLFATTLLERLIALPEPHPPLEQRKSNIRINGKEK